VDGVRIAWRARISSCRADPTFGLLMPSQGPLANPELDHRSVYRFDPATGELRRMASL
jgi:hypothetical protein